MSWFQTRANPLGKFWQQPLILKLFPYFVYTAHLTKFTRGSSLFIEKSLLLEKSKAEESPWLKKEKNKEAQRRQKVYHSVKKGKHSLVLLNESDWYWQSSTLASRFPIKKSPSNQNLPYIMLKTRCSFLYASTSLDTKTLTIASNRNFKSCLSIRCLAPQHIMRFFHFCRGVLATLLIIVSSSSTLH